MYVKDESMSVLLVELNEINIEHVRAFSKMGKLPTFEHLLAHNGVIQTTSEFDYQKLEPWIQWVTAHTGLDFADHGVFRLGDIVDHDILQIWEHLEQKGLSVGAISPMNASNKCINPAFFVPDPWTQTTVTGSLFLKNVSAAVAQAVNDNAQARITPRSAMWIAAGLAAYTRPRNWGYYLGLLTKARKPWIKAMLLDCLLGDIFVTHVRRYNPDFASLFLNAGAHIQHHYMFNSAAYSGENVNPEWYVSAESDPVLEVYTLYDRLICQIQKNFPERRLLLATGLHQEPYATTCYYWRLKSHDLFLKNHDVPFSHIEPRMSRDFVVYCQNESQATEAERRLNSIVSMDGTPLFSVDNRGANLFVMLTWPHDIPSDFNYMAGNRMFHELRGNVSFVAIKNGEHNGTGYLIDTARDVDSDDETEIPLRELPARIAAACGVAWP